MTSQLAGVIAAIATPVDADGRPDATRFLEHARWSLAHGCDGLNVLGTTGEATSFSLSQRRALMEGAATGLDGGRMMVGTGAPDLETTVELTRLAADLGFAGALVLPPYYFKGISDDALFEWFRALVEATSAAPIDLYLYNFPRMTGVPYSPALVRRLVARFGDRIVGLKDSSGDLAYAADLARIPGFKVFPSNEASLARAAIDGFAGCISATVNITSAESAALRTNPGDPDVLARVSYLRGAISAEPLVPAVKYLLSRRLNDTAWARPALPWLPLSPEQRGRLDAIELG